MSQWKYETTEEEEAAAAMLRGKGWDVKQPTCPDCHGMGVVFNYGAAFTVTSGGIPRRESGDLSPRLCPRGCPSSAWYFPNTAGSAPFSR